ncbi:autotransporter domain-containing protein, partial [Burkholderia sp. Bp9143]|uniref:autotransporter outer membrane beta-barrel domain-containing protein n=1 Tax=Burkholderia sp. Bp9143 TaxID=2184574 RepID=UPI000F5AD72E
LGSGGSLASTGAVNLAGTGATFDVSGASGAQTIGALSGAAGANVNLGATALTLNGSGNGMFGGTIGGTGAVTVAGTGTQTLTGANTYTGGTTINGGSTLALGAGGSLASGSTVNLAGTGATFDLSGASGAQTLGTLTGTAGTNVSLGANALTLNGSGNGTFGGAIGGTGGLTLAGTGTQTLTGANTYTGGTTINGGSTLALGAGGSLASTGAVNLAGTGATFDLSGASGTQTIGALTGTAGTNVNLGATALALNGSGTSTFGGVIGGTGGLTLAGTGTQTLTGANTYTGGTTINGGSTLALGSGGSLASTGAVNLAGTGATFDVSGAAGAQTIGALSGAAGSTVNLGANALALNGSGNGTFGGVIGGTGGLTVAGTGIQTLTGSNTYTGGTTIAAGGTLQLGNGGTSGSVAGNVVDNGALIFNQSANVTLASVLSGTGSLTQAGSGQLTLTGTNTLSGPTTVAAGTLAVAGSLGQSTVTVQNGATLTGTGTIGGLVVQSGAFAAASQPGAALNVAGNVTFQPGSTLQVAVTPQQGGSIAAGGTATLNGGTVQVLANQASFQQTTKYTILSASSGGRGTFSQAGYQPTTKYTILSASSGVQGTFSQVISNYAFLMPTLSYDPDHVYLQLVANGTSLPDVATTPNQRAVATAIGALGAGNTLYDTVLTTDAATARRAYGMLDGELQASLKSMLLLDSRYVREAVTDRVRQGLAPGSGPLAALSSGGAALCGDNTAGATDPTLSPERRIGSREGCYGGTPYQPVVWGQAFGGRSRLAGDDNASTINRSMTGFIAGADMVLNDKWRAGLAAGVTHSSLDNGQSSSASVNSYYLSLYGGAQYGALGVRGGASYTWYRINSDRYPGFAGFSDHDSAGYNANSAQVFGEVGYALPVGPVALEPFAGLAYVNLHTDGYTESGGAAALRAGGQTTHVGFSTLGLRAASQLGTIASGTFTARGTVGWRHAFGNVRPSSAFTFANGGTSFQVSGVPIARDSAVLEAGIDAAITKRLTLGLTFSGQYGSGVRDNAVLGNILWKF